MDQSPALFRRWLNMSAPEVKLTKLERSTTPDALMSLFMRIQTVEGPRTLIASGITVATASRISEALALSGHYAEFVDQCSNRETVVEHVQRNKRELLPKIHQLDQSVRHAVSR